MIALLKKELSSFLNSLIGYVVIVVFLLMMGLFLWVFPGEPNILMNQYAGIDGLFSITPYLYIFLVPAITMKSFSEEKKSGTIEFLLTKPLSEFQIIFAKYLAGFVLLLIALIPSFVYYYSVYKLGNPVGNIDIGSTNGSYIGLVMLGSAFVSVGIFASILSDSQIISFLIGVFLSFFF
jgi:ABC-2 type transport system permease protein